MMHSHDRIIKSDLNQVSQIVSKSIILKQKTPVITDAMLEQDQAANDDDKYETVEMVDGMNNIQTIALNGSSEEGTEGTGDFLTERLNTVEFDEKLVAQEAAEPMMIKAFVPND